MAVAASVFGNSKISGLLVKSRWVIVTWLYLSSCLISLSDAEFMDVGCRGSSVSKDDTSLASSLIASPPLLHRSIWKHLSSPSGQDLALASAGAPNYGSVITGHSPSRLQLSSLFIKSSSSTPPVSGFVAPNSVDAPSPMSPQAQVSNCCGPDTVLLQGSKGCQCVYPVKVDLLLLNVSQSPNWALFLDEFASALGLSVPQLELINFYWISLASLNISMDITPLTSISFSSATVSAINTSLTLHKVYLNSKSVGVGDYKLLNLTWFQPAAPSPAPMAAAPSAEAPVVPLPASNSSSTSKKRAGHITWIILSGLGAFVLIITTVTLLIIRNRSTRPEMPNLSFEDHDKPRTIHSIPIGGSLPHHTSTQFIPYEELKQATNNFEHASLLGEGGFGRVYKGVLNDGTIVAIKRLSSGGQQGNKEFLVEVEMLSRLHHRNLVKLVGYYSSRESSETLLCYELVPNGNLEAWLHGPLGVDCPLDWDTRMKIALDAARGLAYLHEDSQPSVIHRDFKASNILLENNFNAKVSDFGLAKQAPEGQMNYLSTRVMGTFGYVAPEYAMTGHLIVKSDVYSYGVVLLELLTGRKPVDMLQPSGQENLVTWTRPMLRNKDRLEELADPKLQGKYSKEDFVRVCTIAAACVATAANQRPTMGEVVQSLKMVQRFSENPDPAIVRPNHRQSSTNFDSDGTSTVFSSGPYSGMNTYDNDNTTRTAVLSEDLQEGR